MSNPKQSETGGPMMPNADIAIELLRCAISWDPEARLLGNLRACEIARIAAEAVARTSGSCPACGAEPWVNIDCPLCAICSILEDGTVPAGVEGVVKACDALEEETRL